MMEDTKEQSFTPTTLSFAAGVLVSLLLYLVPLFYPAFQGFSDARKQGVNIVALLVVSLAVGLLSCYTDIRIVECTQLGLFELGKMFFAAATGNAATYVTTSRIGDKAVAKVQAEVMEGKEGLP